MDFFQAQDRARRNTVKLVVLYLLAVISIIVAVYLVVIIAFGYAGEAPPTETVSERLWHFDTFLTVALIILAVISIGSLYRMSQLRKGGSAVAEMLGGRKVEPSTRDPKEQQLMNVVEEMSIASGVPVPDVYVMDREENINAFAAGFGTDDAAIGVTRGALDKFNRDELQGVIAHEYSHIFNGDMRLNIRLIGILNGILLLHVMGMILMRSMMFSGMRGGGGRQGKGGGGALAAMMLLGLALVIVGYIGMIFGRMIQAAISRQREFLADAAAVQYTRNPGGIAGALRKIANTKKGGKINDGHAMEMSHMFFVSSFGRLFATHPPVEERIKAIDPTGTAQEERKKKSIQEELQKDRVAGAADSSKQAGVAGHEALKPEVILAAIGTMQREQIDRAGQLLRKIPPVLRQAAHEPLDAEALIYALLLAAGDVKETPGWLSDVHGAEMPDRVEYFVRQLGRGRREWFLPLAELSMPALRLMSKQQYQQFRESVEKLVKEDQKTSLFEFALEKMIVRQLDKHFSRSKVPKIRHRNLKELGNEIQVLISTLAHAAEKDSEQAWQVGIKPIQQFLSGDFSLLPEEKCDLDSLDRALTVLASSSNPVKKYVLTAAIHCITADQKISLEERELLRAVAEAIDCPMPIG